MKADNYDLERFEKFPEISNETIEKTKDIINIFDLNGININFVKPNDNKLSLIIVGEMVENVKNQKWCEISILGGLIGVCLSTGDVFFIMKDFITMQDGIKKIKEFLKNE